MYKSIQTYRDSVNWKTLSGWRGMLFLLATIAGGCSDDGGVDDSTSGAAAAGGASTSSGGAGTSSANSGGTGTGGLSTGGEAGNTGGDVGTGGGGGAGTGGSGTGGTTVAAGGTPGVGGSGSGGTPAVGGSGSGGAGSGGEAGNAGGSPGAGGSAGNGPFVCNQVTGFTVTSEWYLAGFESVSGGVDDSEWQLKWQSGSYVDKWADPNGEPWSAEIISPCASDSASPDRVVWTVLSWEVYSQQEWETKITDALAMFDIKYPNVKQYDLLTIVRGPGNQPCPPQPADESVAIPAELDAAIAAVAAGSDGRIVQGPKFEATDCATTFDGAGPHLISPGVEAMAVTISEYYAGQ